MGYKRIRKKIAAEDQVKLSQGTLSYWFNNDVKMVGGENYFDAKPSPELSYILGLIFGDGSIAINEKKQDYSVRLGAVDKDFVENFSSKVATILKKEKPYPICFTAKRTYDVMIRSKKLYYFLKSVREDFEKAKPFVEEFPADFICGLADSEGTACVSPFTYRGLTVYVAVSTNLTLLEYVQKLLESNWKLKTIIRKMHWAGETDSIIDGRKIMRTKDVYRLELPTEPAALRYSHLIGFTIKRKVQRIEDYRYIVDRFGFYALRTYWPQLYYKKGRMWIRSTEKKIDEFRFID